MQLILNIAIILAVGFTAGVLMLGLFNMMRGGPGNLSQRLMRLRVIGQAVAVALLIAALFLFGGSMGG